MNAVGNAHRSEKGQAIVLIVLSIVVLFGFAALAVDGGQIYAARRSAQAAADAAAMAAAYDAAGGSKDRTQALSLAFASAKTNGYDNDQINDWVVVNNPPVGGQYCGVCGLPNKKEYFQVRITVRTNTIFAHLLNQDILQTTVEAVSHAESVKTISGDDALLSLSQSEDSFKFNGTNDIFLDGGNIRSMGKMEKKGASGGITVTNGHVYYVTWDGKTGPFTDAKPQYMATSEIGKVPAPYCPTKNETVKGVNYYYHAGNLPEGKLQPGVHCVKGGIGKGDYSGDNVLIVLMTGGIKQTGNDSLNFTSASNLIDANGNQFGGMVLYVPPTNHSELNFGGNSEAYFEGTIFAPSAFCDVGGNPDGKAYRSAIICDQIRFHGNPALKMNYKASEQFRLPPSVELVQ